MKKLGLITVALLAATGSAQAIEYSQPDIARSSLKFVSKQMGVPVDGQFGKFAAQVVFDPAAPTKGSARLDIDLASIDAGSKDANDEVAGKAWFNVKAHPTARFVSNGVRPLGGERYEVFGKMTIKGRTLDVSAPFTFKPNGNKAVVDGGFTLKRADFGIGEGPWADFGTVANEVQIKFRFELAAAGAKK